MVTGCIYIAFCILHSIRVNTVSSLKTNIRMRIRHWTVSDRLLLCESQPEKKVILSLETEYDNFANYRWKKPKESSSLMSLALFNKGQKNSLNIQSWK